MKKLCLFLFNSIFKTSIKVADLDRIAELIQMIGKFVTEVLPEILKFLRLIIGAFSGEVREAGQYLKTLNTEMEKLSVSRRKERLLNAQKVMSE